MNIKQVPECRFCGSENVVERIESRTTSLFGLENVLLRNLRVHVCGHCNEEAFLVPYHDSVMREVRERLCFLKRRLIGHEFAFLRDGLSLRGQELAAVMKVHPVSVSRWENEKQDVDGTADSFIRALTLVALGIRNAVDVLLHLDQKGIDHVEIDLVQYDEGTCYRFETSYQIYGHTEPDWHVEINSVRIH